MSRPASLHRQLLDQDRHLATKDGKRPQQASLRRAVSTAYYALFHFLIDETGRKLLGTMRADRHLKEALAQAFVHGEMYKASRSFSGGSLPDALKSSVSGRLPAALTEMAETFVTLQERRHAADYDLAAQFSRQDAMDSIKRVDAAMTAWEGIRDDPAARVYLLSLLIGDRLRGK